MNFTSRTFAVPIPLLFSGSIGWRVYSPKDETYEPLLPYHLPTYGTNVNSGWSQRDPSTYRSPSFIQIGRYDPLNNTFCCVILVWKIYINICVEWQQEKWDENYLLVLAMYWNKHFSVDQALYRHLLFVFVFFFKWNFHSGYEIKQYRKKKNGDCDQQFDYANLFGVENSGCF